MSTWMYYLLIFCFGAPQPATTSARADGETVATTQRVLPESVRMETLSEARVGDWAVYGAIVGTDSGTERLRVVHQTLLLTEIEVRTTLSGKPVGLPAIREHRQTFDYALDGAESDGATVRVAEDTIDAAGRRWRCRRTLATWRQGRNTCERRVWMNRDVPLYGLVRMEWSVNGKPAGRLQLVEFGREQPTSQPGS